MIRKEGTNEWLRQEINTRCRHGLKNPITSTFIEDLDISINSNECSITFLSCTFNKKVYVNPSTIGKSDILFIDCTFKEDVEFRENIVNYKKCTFEQKLVLNLAGSNSFSLEEGEGNTYNKIHLKAHNSSLSFIGLKESSTKKWIIEISGSANSIFISNCYLESLITNIIAQIQNVNVILSTIIYTEGLFNGSIKELNVLNSNFRSPLSIANYKFIGDLKIAGSTFFKIDFNLNNIGNASIYFKEIEHINLFGNLKDSSNFALGFESSKYNKGLLKSLKIENVRMSGSFKISDIMIEEDGTLIISNSDLGKSNFINCDFNKAEFQFTNSKIYETFLFHTSFPKLNTKGFNETQHLITKELYGQLALAYSNMGDSVDSQDFHSREIESFFRSIKWWRNPMTKFNLLLNFLSNRFGVSWFQGVGFTFIIGFLFYCLLLISTNEYYFGLPSWNWNLVPSFIRFMNPIRLYELEKLFGDSNLSISKWSFVVDFIGRIFIAYGYYQTIQAFRRFGKR